MWFERSRGVAGVVLSMFVATLCLPLVSETHAFGGDVDTAWGERGIVVCHPDTQVEVPKPGAGDDHCAICHWVRTFGASVVGARIRPLTPSSSGLVVANLVAAGSSGGRVTGPPRGPPPSSL
jgi:hypothetical protein